MPNNPPRQSNRGQLIDAITMLLLIFATLFATTYLVSAGGSDGSGSGSGADRPISSLPITGAEKAQYHKMIDAGIIDRPGVVAAVQANRPGPDKYPVDAAVLAGAVLLLAAYLGFVYRASLRQYREVVVHKFGPRTGESES